jgi:hypothetical protein
MADMNSSAIFGREFSIGLLAHISLPFVMAAMGLPHLDAFHIGPEHTPHP